MTDKKVLDGVMKVGFDIGGGRCPESFPFPACLASALRFMGEEYSWKTVNAHDRDFRLNMANVELLGASGMAFGLLWDMEYCPSCLDLTQINSHDITIDRAFKWAGYDYEILEQSEVPFEIMKDRIKTSIDNNIPVLSFGMVGPPECVIVTGYDLGGDVTIGWSYFQQECEKEQGGQFRKLGWYFDTYKVIIIGDRIGRTLSGRDAMEYALEIMESNESGCYLAGNASYEIWINFILNDDLIMNASDEELFRLHWLHQAIVGSHGEARDWGAYFIKEIAGSEPKMADKLKNAAGCFEEIYSLMWELKGVTSDTNDKNSIEKFRDSSKRSEVAALIKKAQHENNKAMGFIKSALK